jgi:hypothetical protein
MTCPLDEHENVFQRGIVTHSFNEEAEPLTGIFKREGRTTFKAAMAFQKCEGDEASDMPDLSHINSNIQGFVHEQRDGLEVKRVLQRVCHGVILPERFGAIYLQLIYAGCGTNEEATTMLSGWIGKKP